MAILGRFYRLKVNELPKDEVKKSGVRFAPEPEVEDIQTKPEVCLIRRLI